MPTFDTSTPAVLVRLDRNPFHHGTLGAVRSLGRAGIEVHAVVESRRSPVVRSRHLRGAHPRPPGETDLAGVRRLLLSVSDHVGRPAVLVPLDDVSAIAAGRLRDGLAGRYLLPDQPSGLAERVADKAELVAVCEALGVPHPRTALPGSAAQAAAAARALGLPAVAKWSRPWLIPEGSGLRSTCLVRTAREARDLYARGAEAGSRLLLQEFLPPGRGLDWFFHGYAGRDASCPLGATGRKERSWPVDAGLTAVGRWLPNPAVESAARRLVAALGYRGILDLDFRLDPGTGAYHLLDFNPRPGAQFRLFTDRSGLDVVRALHLDLTGRRVPAQTPAYGRSFVVENYALLSLAASLAAPGRRRAGAPAPGAPPAARPRTEAAWFAADDPGPAAAMAAAWTLHAARRVLPGVRAAGAPAARTGAPAAAVPRPARDDDPVATAS
ncbi:carboxylate--amine ligase [Streptomyces sp. 8L]|uniref:carboxylate--amine ligase n=1 Tax=Streptomyces sp. 8L TaxID=2877242 RepID=UPI001CD1CFC1|nr:ATP-grasp domain-containing protein [Streptomyces sp. 8L]MCA1223870.1 ATP-grasp domain-containing protein [Streptomyces sp. 8L]